MSEAKKLLYLAGPMRGIPQYNFPAFDEMRDLVNATEGYEAISPADLDRKRGHDPARLPEDHDWSSFDGMGAALSEDVAVIARCDGLLVLDGWERSTGTAAEILCAFALRKFIYRFRDGRIQRATLVQPKIRIL